MCSPLTMSSGFWLEKQVHWECTIEVIYYYFFFGCSKPLFTWVISYVTLIIEEIKFFFGHANPRPQVLAYFESRIVFQPNTESN